MQYADDINIVDEENWKNIWTIKATLQLFKFVSGLKVNFRKSSLIGVNIHPSLVGRGNRGTTFRGWSSSVQSFGTSGMK